MEQRIELFTKMANECTTKEGGSQTDVDEMIAKKPASSKAGKCVRACVAETIGMVRSFDLVLYKYLKNKMKCFFFSILTEGKGQPCGYGKCWHCCSNGFRWKPFKNSSS